MRYMRGLSKDEFYRTEQKLVILLTFTQQSYQYSNLFSNFLNVSPLLTKRSHMQECKNIQQRGFASGHPPNY